MTQQQDNYLIQPTLRAVVGDPQPVWKQDRFYMIEAIKKHGRLNVSISKVWCIIQYLENRMVDYTMQKQGRRYLIEVTKD